VKELLINFYRQTFKQEFLQPLNTSLAEISAFESLIKYLVYLAAFIYILGFHPSRWLVIGTAVVMTLGLWWVGKKLIKHRVPHTQAEITNSLNPQMVAINRILENTEELLASVKSD